MHVRNVCLLMRHWLKISRGLQSPQSEILYRSPNVVLCGSPKYPAFYMSVGFSSCNQLILAFSVLMAPLLGKAFWRPYGSTDTQRHMSVFKSKSHAVWLAPTFCSGVRHIASTLNSWLNCRLVSIGNLLVHCRHDYVALKPAGAQFDGNLAQFDAALA